MSKNKDTVCKKKASPIYYNFLIKNKNHLFINNIIYLCLNDANQLSASSELYKTFRISETADCLLKWSEFICISAAVHIVVYNCKLIIFNPVVWYPKTTEFCLLMRDWTKVQVISILFLYISLNVLISSKLINNKQYLF